MIRIHAFLLTVAAAAVFGLSAGTRLCAGDSSNSDWPQWRGPDRNGVAPNSPPLLDAFPEKGPKLLWKSEPIKGLPSGGMMNNDVFGGCGSVTVAGGKAYYYAHGQFQIGKVRVTDEILKDWGWMDGVPEDLSKKVEDLRAELRKSHYESAIPKEKQEAGIKKIAETLAPEQAKKFADYLQRRVMNGKFAWVLLERLATVRGQEFDGAYALAKAAGVDTHPHGEGAGIVVPLEATGRRITDTIVCLDAETGKHLWQADFEGQITISQHYKFGASCTPTVAGDRLYFSGSAGVYCISAKDGKEIWKKKAPFTYASPIVYGGLVGVSCEDGFTAYDANTGEVRWNQPDVRDSNSSAAVWTGGGTPCFVVGTHPVPAQYRTHYLACMDVKTGKLLWKAHTVFNYSTPAIAGDIAVTFNKGNVTGYQLDLKSGKVLWNSKEGYDERGASALVYDGCAYLVGGGYMNSGAHCYDLKTGALKWTQPYPHTETGSAVLADGKIFAFASLTGPDKKPFSAVVMFKANPEKYEQLGAINEALAGEPFNRYSTPTPANGRLYLRLKGAIACFDLRK
ncbi:MAG: PQQ-like beta-propeller repeat protein [Planctomycetota bacterium]|nr:PQQ-like beta-propeller repeat protein [Planctomycetota bacterium]